MGDARRRRTALVTLARTSGLRIAEPCVPRLLGTCNQCGLCCTALYNGKPVVCGYLGVDGTIGFGKPGGTRCTVYDRRTHGMPVPMLDPETSRIAVVGSCAADGTVEETLSILRWVQRGACSLIADPPLGAVGTKTLEPVHG